MMNRLNKYRSVTGLVLSFTLSGCFASDAPQKTAEAFLNAMIPDDAQPGQIQMYKSSPQYRQGMDCLANHLEQTGWSESDYEKLMELTDNTAKLDRVSVDLSEDEEMRYFGPLMTSNCF